MAHHKKKHQSYLNDYEMIELTQPLAHSKYIKQIYRKTLAGKWFLTYETNSTYHICPYDGIFRNCEQCGADREDFDVNYCKRRAQYIDEGDLRARIKDCKEAGLSIHYVKEIS